jgi:hypothetical protein
LPKMAASTAGSQRMPRLRIKGSMYHCWFCLISKYCRLFTFVPSSNMQRTCSMRARESAEWESGIGTISRPHVQSCKRADVTKQARMMMNAWMNDHPSSTTRINDDSFTHHLVPQVVPNSPAQT